MGGGPHPQSSRVPVILLEVDTGKDSVQQSEPYNK